MWRLIGSYGDKGACLIVPKVSNNSFYAQFLDDVLWKKLSFCNWSYGYDFTDKYDIQKCIKETIKR